MSLSSRARRAMVALVATGVLAGAGTHAAAATTRGGDAVVVEGADSSKVLDHGASATVFGLRLPAGAACPGDTQHDQWRVQSFMVPDGVDPGSLTFDSTQPHGTGMYALYASDTKPYVQQATGSNTEAGRPGNILDLPPLSFKVFTPGLLASGTYRIGVACTLAPERRTAVYWDAPIVIVADANDHPAGFIWRIAGAPSSLTKVEGGSNAGVIALVALVVVAVLVLLLWRRSRRTPPTTPQRPTSRTRATALSKESS